MKRLHLGLLEFVPLRSTFLACAAEACEHMLLQFPKRVSACHRLLLALQFGRFFFNLLIGTDSTNRSEFHRGCHSVAIFFKRIWLKK